MAISPKCDEKRHHRIRHSFRLLLLILLTSPDGEAEGEAVEDFTIIDDYDDLAYVQEMLAHQR